jgi:hypothetical protein
MKTDRILVKDCSLLEFYPLIGKQQAREMENLELVRAQRRFAEQERVKSLSQLNPEGFPLLAPRLNRLEAFIHTLAWNQMKEETDHAVPVASELCGT